MKGYILFEAIVSISLLSLLLVSLTYPLFIVINSSQRLQQLTKQHLYLVDALELWYKDVKNSNAITLVSNHDLIIEKHDREIRWFFEDEKFIRNVSKDKKFSKKNNILVAHATNVTMCTDNNCLECILRSEAITFVLKCALYGKELKT